MIDVNRIETVVGLDIDGTDKQFLQKVQKNAAVYGEIQTTKSRHGYHIKIQLFKPVTLRETLWIRMYLSDDTLRLLFDALRIISDIDNLNVLWDEKQIVEIKSIIKKIEVLS